MRLGYVRGHDELKGVRFRYPDGAPTILRHTVELAPGRYRVVAELRGPGLERTVERALRVPAQAVVHMELFNEALAAGRGWPLNGIHPGGDSPGLVGRL